MKYYSAHKKNEVLINAKWNKPDATGQIVYDSTHMSSLE